MIALNLTWVRGFSLTAYILHHVILIEAGNDNGGSGAPNIAPNNNAGNNNNKALNRMSTYSVTGVTTSQVSPSSATNLDLTGRAKSREFLRM